MSRLSRRAGASSGQRRRARWILPALLSSAALLFLPSLRLALLKQPSHTPAAASFSQFLSTSVSQSTATAAQDTASSQPPVVIAYAISLIKCGDFQSSVAGMTDAARVLRHSIHQTSIRNPASGSAYDYHVYALVHSQAAHCATELEEAGFTLIIKDAPINPKTDIQDPFLRKNIHKEWCCSSDEFIKLFSYTLTQHPIVVHVDIDFVFARPMDDLYDAMLLDASDPKAIAARARIPLERSTDPWPNKVDAFMTRDWGQVMPGRKPLFQAGFIVSRPDLAVFERILKVIRETKYVEGFSRENGWGGKGYGVYVGAMAMQGLLAYVYDQILPGTWMELNQCRFNHMGMDVRYRSPPSFRKGHAKVGACRNDLEECEDCMVTPVEEIYNIHYTQCRKPWNCIGIGTSDVQGKAGGKTDKLAIPENSVNLTHCMELQTIWHSYRTDLERQLHKLTADDSILATGDYKTDVFQGHCTADGGSNYVPIQGKPESLLRLSELYKK